jgi:hypothetical protein
MCFIGADASNRPGLGVEPKRSWSSSGGGLPAKAFSQQREKSRQQTLAVEM